MNDLQIFWAVSQDEELKLNLALTYIAELAESVGGKFDAKMTMESDKTYKLSIEEVKDEDRV